MLEHIITAIIFTIGRALSLSIISAIALPVQFISEIITLFN